MTTGVVLTDTYALYCEEANVAVYLYSALCLQPFGYGERIDKSERGYLLWLYAGSKSLNIQMLKVLNTALENINMSIRVRKEVIVEAPALGRRSHVGNRFVLRLERPGLTDLMGDDGDGSETSAWVIDRGGDSALDYAAIARYMPRLAQRHMSYVDVDTKYDIGFKPTVMARGFREYSCHILENQRVITSFNNPYT